MVMSYATPENQGSYLSTFWVIFNCGAASGGLFGFGLNFYGDSGTSATHGGNLTKQASGMMYAVFIGVMSAGVLLAVFGIVDSNQVIREDGSAASDTSQRNEITEVWWVVLRQQFATMTTQQLRAFLCLPPLFAYSNWFYTYHSFFNVSVFTVRTSGLASSFYWIAQMGSACVVGRALDAQVHKRTSAIQAFDFGLAGQQEFASIVADVGVRSLVVLTLLANTTWAVGWYLQSALDLQYDCSLNFDVFADFHAFFPPFLLYAVYGWNDALCQVWIYWYMSSLADRDAVASGQFAGIYKGVQAISAAIAWHLGAVKMDPQNQLFLNWLLCNIAMLGAYISVASFRSAKVDTEGQPLLVSENSFSVKRSIPS